MGTRRVVSLILSLGLVGCGGITPSTIPTPQATIATASPAPTLGPIPAATATSPTATLKPKATSKPASQTPRPVPPKPRGVKFDEQRRVGNDASSTKITQTVTWRTPRGEDVEIRVYGVTECIAQPEDPTPGHSGPCLVVGTPLPASARTLLAKAPASDGLVRWSWRGTFECGEPRPAYDPDGPAYRAVVLAAYNGSGHSTFAIASPGRWYEPAPDEIIC
jgi:hypothetical protein